MSRQWNPERRAFIDMAERAKVVMERTGRCEGYFSTLNLKLYADSKGPDPNVCPGCYHWPDCPLVMRAEAEWQQQHDRRNS